MFDKTFFRGMLAAILIGGSLFFTPAAQAEIQICEGVGEYEMGERDTLETAKQGAKDRAIRNALEKAGVLIQTRSRTENLELIEDVITSQTGAVLKVVEAFFEREDFLVRATVKVEVDVDDLNRRLENAAKLTDADKISLANKKADEATKLWQSDDDEAAIALMNEAIALNPNDSTFYAKRGMIYFGRGELSNAARDAEKTLALDPEHVMSYVIRAAFNMETGQNAKAIADLNTALRIDDGNKYAYYFRGIYYKQIGDRAKAREDFLRAKELGFYGNVARKFLEGDS